MLIKEAARHTEEALNTKQLNYLQTTRIQREATQNHRMRVVKKFLCWICVMIDKHTSFHKLHTMLQQKYLCAFGRSHFYFVFYFFGMCSKNYPHYLVTVLIPQFGFNLITSTDNSTNSSFADCACTNRFYDRN